MRGVLCRFFQKEEMYSRQRRGGGNVRESGYVLWKTNIYTLVVSWSDQQSFNFCFSVNRKKKGGRSGLARWEGLSSAPREYSWGAPGYHTIDIFYTLSIRGEEIFFLHFASRRREYKNDKITTTVEFHRTGFSIKNVAFIYVYHVI